MTTNTLAGQVADALNRHGKFTARATENAFCVEVRFVDTGRLAAEVWTPDAGLSGEWNWDIPGTGVPRSLRGSAGVEEIVRAVATSVLDERPKP